MNEKTTQLTSPTHHFTVILSPTPRGARLARLLTVAQLRSWGLWSGVTEAAQHVVAELAASASTHGRLRGRDFLLALFTTTGDHALRIEVTDTRGDRLPNLAPCPDRSVRAQ